MHAYLIIGTSDDMKLKKAESIASHEGAQIYNFDLKKIEDTRKLTKFLKFYPQGKSLILIKDIDLATPDAQNSFLKSLEERDQYFFCLTAKSKYSPLPTIVSRCQIIDTKSDSQTDYSQIKEFLDMNTADRLLFIDQIKTRQEAQNFIDTLLIYGQKILKDESYPKNMTNILKQALLTGKALQANTNVLLQLTNFVVSLDRE